MRRIYGGTGKTLASMQGYWLPLCDRGYGLRQICHRTMILKNPKAYVQAGTGVVYDSVPENEFYETINRQNR